MLKSVSGLAAARTVAIAALFVAGALPATAQDAAQPAEQDAMQTTVVQVTSRPSATAAKPVNFTGQAVIKSRLDIDKETGNHTLVLTFDMSGVTGQSETTGNRTLNSVQETLVRRLAPSQEIEFPFPIAPPNPNHTLQDVSTGTARFSLNVDLATGAITSAAGRLPAVCRGPRVPA
jgi:hypothetical protein